MAAPAWAANTSGLSPQMWERIRAALPRSVDLTPTPSPEAPAQLSVKQCVELAFRHNAGFRNAQDALLNARGGLWVADQSLTYTASASTQREKTPGGVAASASSASARASWERLGGDTLSLNVDTLNRPELSDFLRRRPALTLAYERPLLRGAGLASSRYQEVRQANVALLTQEIAFYDSRQELALSIIQSYFNTLLAQGEIEIARRTVDRAQNLYDINYAKFTGEGLKKEGEVWVSQIAGLDVDRAELSLKVARQGLIAQEQALKDAMDTLLVAIGLRPGSTPTLTTKVEYTPQPYDQAALTQAALANSTDLARLNLGYRDAIETRRLAYSASKPDLVATAAVSDAGETAAGVTPGSGWSAGLRVDLPLWDRSLAEAKASADRTLRVLGQQLIARHDSVTQEIQRLVRAAESTKASIAIGEENVKLAQKNLEAARGMYAEGLRDLLTVSDADNGLVEAERSLLQLKIEYFVDTVSIRQALGEDVTQGLPG